MKFKAEAAPKVQHPKAWHGELNIGFHLGSEGYMIVEGPGLSGHGLNAPGFDGVAFHPKTGELIIYDNKALKASGNVSKATAIALEVNLGKNLDALMDNLKFDPRYKDMPNRMKILERVKQTRQALDNWIKMGKPDGALKLPGKTKLVVYNGFGNSTGVGGKLAKSGAISFEDVMGHSDKKPGMPHAAEAKLNKMRKAAEEGIEAGAEAMEHRLVKKASVEVGEGAAKRFAKSKLPGIAAKRLAKLAASKTAKRALSLVPLVGWAFAAKDAWAGVNDVIEGHAMRGFAGIGLAGVDVLSDFLHLGDLVSGPGGTVLSLGVQGATIAGQVKIELDRAAEKMQKLQEEIERTGQLPPDSRLKDEYEMDEEDIRELKEEFQQAQPQPSPSQKSPILPAPATVPSPQPSPAPAPAPAPVQPSGPLLVA